MKHLHMVPPPTPVERFQALYEQLNRDTVSQELLGRCYANQIEFTDPFHSVQGLPALTRYFTELYSNVQHIEFQFHHSLHENDFSLLRWTMTFRHPRIKGGQPVSVEGCSELHWNNGLIISHRDFFDAGAMLYEHLPVLGWAIRKLKERMQ